MKIAIIRQRYNPYGGAEIFVERALGALTAEGAEVSLIAREWRGQARDGIQQIVCNPPYSRLMGGRVARDKSFARCVQREIALGDFDITQSHERIPGCMIFRAGDGVHAAWLDHRKYALNTLQRAFQRISPYHQYVLAAEKAMFEDQVLRAVICNSEMVADEIVQYYGVARDKLKVIYNGVDTEYFHPGVADQFRSSVRVKFRIPADAPLLLFVGGGFERKGVPQLLHAFARMQCKTVRLAIAGGDRKINSMQCLAKRLNVDGRVLFLGPIKDVRPWYGAADAFVLPTLYDPCPNAALEAMACGLPMLTSSRCGAKEWVVNSRNGYVVDPLDLDEMSHGLDMILELSSHEESRQLARSVAANFDLSRMAQNLIFLYRTLLLAP